jgi:DNA-binding response OmpR family regulator
VDLTEWAYCLRAATAGTERALDYGIPGSVPKTSAKTMRAVPRVLVVDDEANHARVMAIGLRIEGFEVETAADAESALRVMAGGPFDLAVVDLMMPGVNGIQLARLIRERFPQTSVVLTSAYHLSERQLVRADCGAVGFVPKPFDLTELARFLRGKLAAADLAAMGEGGPSPGPFVARGAAA